MTVIAVIGSAGRLGTELVRACTKQGMEVCGLSHDEIEITDFQGAGDVLQTIAPDIIINTAAFHDVEECEDNPGRAFEVNERGIRNIAVIANELNAVPVHISTDYVFGFEEPPHAYGCREHDPTDPLNVYGKSKSSGEEQIKNLCETYIICRTSWLFGSGEVGKQKGDFVTKMVGLMRSRDTIDVINDQTGTPSCTRDVAGRIAELVKKGASGTFHVANSSMATWYEYAVKIKTLLGADVDIKPISSKKFFRKAKRPHFSALDNYNMRKIGMNEMRTWQSALAEYVNGLLS